MHRLVLPITFIGPGAYNVDPQRVRALRNSRAAVEWQEIPLPYKFNPPSIPSNASAFGYEETLSGELVQQANPEKGFAGTPNDAVGPGQYNAIPPARDLGANWHRSKDKRSSFSLNKQNPIGPGSYSAIKPVRQVLHNTKGTSCFLSRVRRAGLRGAKDVPGPGEYCAQTALEQRGSSWVQQFGTCAPRFARVGRGADVGIGPGEYQESKSSYVFSLISSGVGTKEADW
eukprot:TRINITY_DN15308_c0_g1_i1.p1 TRINITY_DN15308_c0_g1~~TRINITY_DN15308_c0_g1_i1.p1  ORF type:complete len:229 (-),score=13.87 TRINITY_DN15308_c0_g1_i1:761-1447(-)